MAEHPDREHFIPIAKTDLVDLLCRGPQLSADEKTQFRRFCRRLQALLHCEYNARLEELKDAYGDFDPDADFEPIEQSTASERQARLDRLFDRFVELLERANFRRLSHHDVTAALDDASDWGLNLEVDFAVFERLEIFARGDVIGMRTRRRWRNLFRIEEVSVPVYQRLVVMLRLREGARSDSFIDGASVYIKIFKDIPKLDLEMLLPGTRVKLSLADRGRIVLPTLSGLVVAGWKLLQGAISLAVSNVSLGIVGGTVGYGLRSFYGYLQTKQKYQLSLTQSLYYQNLDNNAGAIFRLLNEAEDQEFREAVLAYFFLLTRADERGWSRDRLDDSIEEFLDRSTGLSVDFEIGDALEKLVRFRLLVPIDDGFLRAVPLPEAIAALGRLWQASFDEQAVAAEPLRRSA